MRVIQKALTFDDVLLLPAHSRVLPREVSLKTRLTDRKSTRLNSSHLVISYAVFCLKKKKTAILQFCSTVQTATPTEDSTAPVLGGLACTRVTPPHAAASGNASPPDAAAPRETSTEQ